jgi:hypothetical protein
LNSIIARTPSTLKAFNSLSFEPLDRSQVKGSILNMKAGILLSLGLALFASQVLAQDNVTIGRTNVLSFETRMAPYLNPETQARSSDIRLGKQFRASGPLIHLFHTRRPGEVPKRFWQLVNPFSRSERPAEPEPELPRTRDLSPRAWTTTAGWSPGVSSYTYKLTSPEGGQGIGLVTIGR